MSSALEREVENAIHEYCPVWAKWARLVEERQGLNPEYAATRDAASAALVAAVKRIKSVFRNIQRPHRHGGKRV